MHHILQIIRFSYYHVLLRTYVNCSTSNQNIMIATFSYYIYNQLNREEALRKAIELSLL